MCESRYPLLRLSVLTIIVRPIIFIVALVLGITVIGVIVSILSLLSLSLSVTPISTIIIVINKLITSPI